MPTLTEVIKATRYNSIFDYIDSRTASSLLLVNKEISKYVKEYASLPTTEKEAPFSKPAFEVTKGAIIFNYKGNSFTRDFNDRIKYCTYQKIHNRISSGKFVLLTEEEKYYFFKVEGTYYSLKIRIKDFEEVKAYYSSYKEYIKLRNEKEEKKRKIMEIKKELERKEKERLSKMLFIPSKDFKPAPIPSNNPWKKISI
jgi:hypothetical protein